MGVVKRQGAKTVLLRYLSLPLALFASLFVYPYSTETNDAYGYFNYLMALGTLLFPLIFLGLPNLSIKFFPNFKDEKSGHNGFLSLLFIIIGIGIIVPSLLFLFFSDYIYELLASSGDHTKYNFILLPVALMTGLINLFTYYISNFNRIVVPNAVELIRNRIFVPLLILSIGLGYISFEFFVYLIGGILLFQLGLLVFYLFHLGEFRFTKVNWTIYRENKREIYRFSFYAILGTLGATLSTQIDSIMVTELIDVRSNGVYSIGRNISNMVNVPMKALFAILAPIVAELIKQKNLVEVSALYKKSSNTLLSITLYFFLAIVVLMSDVTSLLNGGEIDYSDISMITLLLGASILFNASTSINSHIITYSRYYAFNIILVLVLGISNIFLNYLFIVVWDQGITGAAAATIISQILYDVVKYIFILVKFKMQPFEFTSLKIVLLGAACFAFFHFVPFTFSPILNVVVKETILGAMFLLPLLFLKWSPEINEWLDSLLAKLKSLLGR